MQSSISTGLPHIIAESWDLTPNPSAIRAQTTPAYELSPPSTSARQPGGDHRHRCRRGRPRLGCHFGHLVHPRVGLIGTPVPPTTLVVVRLAPVAGGEAHNSVPSSLSRSASLAISITQTAICA